MAAPTLTQDQKNAIQNAQAVAIAGEAGALQAEAGWALAIAEQEKIDAAFSSFFDYYDGIIRSYELERRYLDGQDIQDRILEQDLLDFVNEGGRLFDSTSVSNGDYAPTRINQFDGSPLEFISNENESYLISEQDAVTEQLVTFPAQNTSFPGTAETTALLDENSTSLSHSSDGTEVVNVGDYIYVSGGGELAIVEVTGISGTCSDPQYTDQATCETNGGTWTSAYAINFILGPSGPIPSGASLGQASYTGFDNTERTNKTANSLDQQPVMDFLLSRLADLISRRIAALNAESLVISANEDENLDPNALSNVNDSIFFLENAEGNNPPSTLDISNAGLNSLESESANRLTEVNDRISAIPTAIANGSFYDLRYQYAASRARLDNGSLRLLDDYEKAKQGQGDSRATASDLESRYAAILGS